MGGKPRTVARKVTDYVITRQTNAPSVSATYARGNVSRRRASCIWIWPAAERARVVCWHTRRFPFGAPSSTYIAARKPRTELFITRYRARRNLTARGKRKPTRSVLYRRRRRRPNVVVLRCNWYHRDHPDRETHTRARRIIGKRARSRPSRNRRRPAVFPDPIYSAVRRPSFGAARTPRNSVAHHH